MDTNGRNVYSRKKSETACEDCINGLVFTSGSYRNTYFTRSKNEYKSRGYNCADKCVLSPFTSRYYSETEKKPVSNAKQLLIKTIKKFTKFHTVLLGFILLGVIIGFPLLNDIRIYEFDNLFPWSNGKSLSQFKQGGNEIALTGQVEISEQTRQDFRKELLYNEERFKYFNKKINSLFLNMNQNHQNCNCVGFVEDKMRNIVREELAKLNVGNALLADFALESVGGSIISTPNTEHYKSQSYVTIMGVPFWNVANNVRRIIQPGINVGDCWAFEGTKGEVILKLASEIYVRAVTMEHISASLTLNGRIDSAPNFFKVYGVNLEEDSSYFIGSFEYSAQGLPRQTFSIPDKDYPPFSAIKLEILSNHGNPVYTCVYRFRVHGQPYSGGII